MAPPREWCSHGQHLRRTLANQLSTPFLACKTSLEDALRNITLVHLLKHGPRHLSTPRWGTCAGGCYRVEVWSGESQTTQPSPHISARSTRDRRIQHLVRPRLNMRSRPVEPSTTTLLMMPSGSSSFLAMIKRKWHLLHRPGIHLDNRTKNRFAPRAKDEYITV